MSPPTPSSAGDATPPPISPGGTYGIQTITVGCKIYIRRPGPDGEEERLAEILSIRDKPVNAYGRKSATPNGHSTEDQWEFFVHWDSFNKRLDEWVSGSRLVLNRDLEWPRPKATDGKKSAGSVHKAPGKAQTNLLKRATTNAAMAASPAPSTPMIGEYAPSPSPAPMSLKRKTRPDDEEEEEEEEEEDAEGDMDAEGEMDIDGEGEMENFELSLQESVPEPPPLSSFSKEQEIEKLRTSGSMTQSVSEIARVKNLNRLQIGKHEVDACKTLYYDVTPFMYYVLARRDSTGCHMVGYFSKEKESAENYNVACILTLPQHQRHGYGKLLIEFSYELSKKEQKLGSPEKPLSDLGLLGYRAYWAETIIDLLLECPDGEISVDEIAQRTSITHADIMNTCTTLQLFKHFKGQHILCLNNAVLEKHQKNKLKRRPRIHPEYLKWKPPVFTRDQLRFGW
ncbi:hypothetical protein C0993_011178 [Termitomyces sp. T159_Od127]|nr:hypothetical protein C0993_011178 [Termitomyces sp. T159_Od127]